jgi:hypothetical protein
MVRNAAFRRVELAAKRDVAALVEAELPGGLDAVAWGAALAEYYAAHAAIGTGADARAREWITITEHADRWTVRQAFDDPEGDHDFALMAEVDLAESDAAGAPAWRTMHVTQG